MTEVVRLVAVVSLVRVTRRTRKLNAGPDFDVWRYAETDDGRRLLVQSDRGFSEMIPRGQESDYWRTQTAEAIMVEARGVLQPDEPIPGRPLPDTELYWEPVIEALASYGIRQTASDLAELACDVELDPELAALLSN